MAQHLGANRQLCIQYISLGGNGAWEGRGREGRGGEGRRREERGGGWTSGIQVGVMFLVCKKCITNK